MHGYYILYKINPSALKSLINFLHVHVCLLQEVHRLQRESDEANKRSSVLERDNQRCELQLADMAQQVGPLPSSVLILIIFRNS